MKSTQFTGRQFKHYILTLLAYNLGGIPRAMYQLSPFAWLKLNIMYQSSRRNVLQRQSIPGLYINILTCLYSVTQLNVQRSEYITLLPVSIVNQRDPGRPIRVIFNGSYSSRNGNLIPLEIDKAKLTLTAAPTMTHSHHPSAITPCLLFQRHQQGFFGGYSG
jgi:hypothetical protein